jgi:DNA-binding GntR family transcriptional regulator
MDAEKGGAQLIEDIAAQIRDKIASGEYKAGDQLKQEVLAREFNVSRTPIREALSRLEARGIITQQLRRSAVVTTPSSRDILEAYQIRAQLEGLAVQLAAKWITDAELADLRHSHDLFVRAVMDLMVPGPGVPNSKQLVAKRQEASRRWISTNSAFHSAIASCSHNRKLNALLHDLRAGHTEGIMTASAFGMDVYRMETNIRHHEAILAALEARNPEAAKQAMTDHIMESGDYVVGLLSHKE